MPCVLLANAGAAVGFVISGPRPLCLQQAGGADKDAHGGADVLRDRAAEAAVNDSAARVRHEHNRLAAAIKPSEPSAVRHVIAMWQGSEHQSADDVLPKRLRGGSGDGGGGGGSEAPAATTAWASPTQVDYAMAHASIDHEWTHEHDAPGHPRHGYEEDRHQQQHHHHHHHHHRRVLRPHLRELIKRHEDNLERDVRSGWRDDEGYWHAAEEPTLYGGERKDEHLERFAEERHQREMALARLAIARRAKEQELRARRSSTGGAADGEKPMLSFRDGGLQTRRGTKGTPPPNERKIRLIEAREAALRRSRSQAGVHAMANAPSDALKPARAQGCATVATDSGGHQKAAPCVRIAHGSQLCRGQAVCSSMGVANKPKQTAAEHKLERSRTRALQRAAERQATTKKIASPDRNTTSSHANGGKSSAGSQAAPEMQRQQEPQAQAWWSNIWPVSHADGGVGEVSDSGTLARAPVSQIPPAAAHGICTSTSRASAGGWRRRRAGGEG